MAVPNLWWQSLYLRFLIWSATLLLTSKHAGYCENVALDPRVRETKELMPIFLKTQNKEQKEVNWQVFWWYITFLSTITVIERWVCETVYSGVAEVVCPENKTVCDNICMAEMKGYLTKPLKVQKSENSEVQNCWSSEVCILQHIVGWQHWQNSIADTYTRCKQHVWYHQWITFHENYERLKN
jgi:hypothetical protein